MHSARSRDSRRFSNGSGCDSLSCRDLATWRLGDCLIGGVNSLVAYRVFKTRGGSRCGSRSGSIPTRSRQHSFEPMPRMACTYLVHDGPARPEAISTNTMDAKRLTTDAFPQRQFTILAV